MKTNNLMSKIEYLNKENRKLKNITCGDDLK